MSYRFDQSRRIMLPNAHPRLAPALKRWCEEAPKDAFRTAVVRIARDTDVAAAVRALSDEGAQVQSAGAGVITVVASPEALRKVVELDCVLAVEEPRRLFTRAAPGA